MFKPHYVNLHAVFIFNFVVSGVSPFVVAFKCLFPLSGVSGEVPISSLAGAFASDHMLPYGTVTSLKNARWL
jgi:hypothetical protein